MEDETLILVISANGRYAYLSETELDEFDVHKSECHVSDEEFDALTAE